MLLNVCTTLSNQYGIAPHLYCTLPLFMCPPNSCERCTPTCNFSSSLFALSPSLFLEYEPLFLFKDSFLGTCATLQMLLECVPLLFLTWMSVYKWGMECIFNLFPCLFISPSRVVEQSLDQGTTCNVVISHQWMRKITFISIKYFLSQLQLKFNWKDTL